MAKSNAIIIKPFGEISLSPLKQHQLLHCKTIFLNMSPERLAELAVSRKEGVTTSTGALMCDTGHFTGRSPKDKFIVLDRTTERLVDWGEVNAPFDPGDFERLHRKMMEFLAEKQIFVRYAYAGAAEGHRRSLMVVTTLAWHNLFSYNMFIRPENSDLMQFQPEWSVFCIPEFQANPKTDGTRQKNFTIIDFTRKTILIGGSAYAGEIKKSIFTVLNFLLPVEDGALPMHCAANVGSYRGLKNDTALFFGLSGTGKTTLSSDPDRKLVGDDEHGWSEKGIFNFEGGCYAKVINLEREKETQIYDAIRSGAVLENTRFLKNTRKVDYADASVTENTRVSYPLYHIPNVLQGATAQHPDNIFFLTTDACGVLPPLARLTPEQAMFYFVTGYTSKIAGTEIGINEPVATFSPCFGAAFLPLSPAAYTEMLGKRLRTGKTKVWLVNTGWVAGPYGTGYRIPLPYTRALLSAVLQKSLRDVPFRPHPVFGFDMPTACPGVPAELLDPAKSWSDPAAYRAKAEELLQSLEKRAARFGIPKSAQVEFSAP